MITPRKIIKSSDDKYLVAIAKELGMSEEKLFFELISMDKKTPKIINDATTITKKKEEENFSYLIENKEGVIIARIICDF